MQLCQLEVLFLQKDDYYFNHNQSIGYSSSHELSQNMHELRHECHRKRMSSNFICFLHENWKRIWVLILWIMMMIGIFTWKFYQYKESYAFMVMGLCLPTAKGAGETLKLNMAIVLLPMCRNILTWLRSSKFFHFVPFDDNINFHKTVAAAIVVGVILHAGNHLVCDFPRLINAPTARYEFYLHGVFGDRQPMYTDLLMGIQGVSGIIMIILMVLAFTLATRWFRRSLVRLRRPLDRLTGYNTFWYSHHLFAFIYVLLIIHGNFLYLEHDWYKKTTWMYLAVPILLYAGERMFRLFRSNFQSVQLLKVAIYPGNVITLQMTKPSQFKYESGQYMFVQCPTVSAFERHPFSITSAPDDDYLSIHVCQLGDWTQELKRVFSEACEPSDSGKSGLLRADETTKKSMPKLLIDRPFGAPAQDYKKYDMILLVGLGIGATPFISILRNLLNHMIKMKDKVESGIRNVYD